MILVPLTVGVGVVLVLLILRWLSLAESPYFLLEMPEGSNRPPKMILALHDGKLRLMYEATLVAEDGTKSVRILSDDLEVTSDQGGIVTCAVPDLPPVVLNRTTRTFTGLQITRFYTSLADLCTGKVKVVKRLDQQVEPMVTGAMVSGLWALTSRGLRKNSPRSIWVMPG